jgi:hypothetical protein
MVEIDCRKCTNLAKTGAGCTVYGIDPKKACAACRRDLFMNYHPKRTPDEFKPGMAVWCLERDGADNAVGIAGGIFLARVQAAVIVSPYPDDMTDLDDILIHHYEQTRECCETALCVFPSCDCYPAESLAREALAKDREG